MQNTTLSVEMKSVNVQLQVRKALRWRLCIFKTFFGKK